MNDGAPWQQVKALFQTLAERPPAEWEAALRSFATLRDQKNPDEPMMASVKSLLSECLIRPRGTPPQ